MLINVQSIFLVPNVCLAVYNVAAIKTFTTNVTCICFGLYRYREIVDDSLLAAFYTSQGRNSFNITFSMTKSITAISINDSKDNGIEFLFLFR